MSDPVSHYEPLAVKEFKSTIPPHMLAKLSESERYIVETMSKLEGQYDWLLSTAQCQNKAILDLDRRQSIAESWESRLKAVEGVSDNVRLLWDWKNTITGKTGMILLVLAIAAPVLLKSVLDLILKHL